MSDLLQQGLELMALGMGTVFGFLILLILCVILMSTIIRRYSQPEIPVPAGGGGNKNAQLEQIAAVAAAAKAAHQR